MYALETVGDSSVSLRPEQKACRERVFDGKDADPESLSVCRSCLTRSLAETTALLLLFTAIFSSYLQHVQLMFALRTNV